MTYGNGQYDGGQVYDSVAAGSFWVIGTRRVAVREITLTPTTLTLTISLRDAGARRTLRELDEDAGALARRELADGTIEYVDTADGDNTYTVTPSVRHQPPRIERDWLVGDISRDRASADTQAVLGTITLRGKQTRDPAAIGYDDADDADAWEFDFSDGRVVSRRVSAVQQPAGTTSLQIVLSPRQAELVESGAAAVAGAISNTVPDGQAFTRDTTPDDRQTVTVDPPADAADPALKAGTYVVTGWTVDSGSGGGADRMDLSVATRV